MPVSWATIVRVIVLAAMTGHVFLIYTVGRAMSRTTGLDAAAVALLAPFALAVLLPMAWGAIVLLDLPEILSRHRSRKRWEKGLCAACGYPQRSNRGGECPECGALYGEPESFWFGWSAARRFAALAGAAWVLGCVVAETWAWFDETSFVREAQTHLAAGASRYSRSRRWLDGYTLYYSRADGLSARAEGSCGEPAALDQRGRP